ncbi:MAG TPA: xanthine dehydrogenase family protein molybdopterin-binding subunit [Acidimicrobiales bacterium]
MSILGNPVVRSEDPRLLTSGGAYAADIVVAGAAHIAFVRSTVAHARLRSVDTSGASSSPGVAAVVTAADIDLVPFLPPEFADSIHPLMLRPWLADGVVRFCGEAVAAVVAETRAQAVDAAETVVVEYDPLPVIVDPADAEAGPTWLYPEAATNVASRVGAEASGDLFSNCDVVVRQRMCNPKVAAVPMEVRAAAAHWGPDGRLTHWTGTQRPHAVRDELAAVLGVPAAMVRVVTPDVGGAFGARMYPCPEEVVMAWLARRLGRALRWVETRSENLLTMGHGRAQWQDVAIGSDRQGRILAYELSLLQDAGAYPEVGALLPGYTMLMASGTYAIPRIEVRARSVVTNTASVTAFRGAGRPEATAAIERAIDLLAAELAMDPMELRRRNLIPPGDFPYQTVTGATYDSGDYAMVMDRVLDEAGYRCLRAEQSLRRARGDRRQLGIGLGLYTEITNSTLFPQFAEIELTSGGGVVVRTGEGPSGQGHATVLAMMASDHLGVGFDDISVVHGDTDVVREGSGTGGSSFLQTAGIALSVAADAMLELGRRRSAERLEAAVEDVVFDRSTGRFHVAGSAAAGHTWAELAEMDGPPLVADATYGASFPTFPFGAHLVVVEVDVETGKVSIERVVACDDAGRILNPLLAEGQLHGGIAQGLAQALLEEVSYDADGNLLTSTLAEYLAVSAAELPSFELELTETVTPHNSLGAKGIGESGTIGSAPALQNAVVDALAHLGVRHIDMPVTPERVWRAIRKGGEP